MAKIGLNYGEKLQIADKTYLSYNLWKLYD